MASHHLIEQYLAELARRLPADAVDELADGLAETYRHHLSHSPDPNAAARSAIAEFGDPMTVTHAFTRQAPGRRLALMLLATGPAVGICWGVSLLLGRAWAWPIVAPVRLAFGLALLAVVATLVTAATSRHHYARPRVTAIGGVGLIALDTAMLGVVLLAAPTLVWPMAVAIPASLARIVLTARALPRVLVR
jgi:hypothetical protein